MGRGGWGGHPLGHRGTGWRRCEWDVEESEDRPGRRIKNGLYEKIKEYLKKKGYKLNFSKLIFFLMKDIWRYENAGHRVGGVSLHRGTKLI